MNAGSLVELDPTGRPKFFADEIQQFSQDDVDLYDGALKRLRAGCGIVTTHRLMYIHKQTNIAWGLGYVREVAEKGSILGFSSPKVCVHLDAAEEAYIQFSFKNGGCGDFARFLNTALKRRSWEARPAPKRSRVDSDTSTSTRPFIGVSGLLARMEAAREAESQEASQALQDIKALMDNVRRVADTAQTVALKLNRHAASTAASTSSSAQGSAESVRDIAHDFGLANPVTRGVAGATYHSALAKEIATFAQPKLHASGGVLALTDIYCLYNRARGTDLVAPEDFASACGEMAKLHLGMHSHVFNTGLHVLQLDTHGQSAMQRRIQDMLGTGGSALVDSGGRHYTTALHSSSSLKIPMPVVKQYLLDLERNGSLCRDEGLHGTRFYVNVFF